MNRKIFTCHKCTIRIRDAVLVLVLLLLFFFCMQSCRNQAVQKQKRDKLFDNQCSVIKENINVLNELLAQSDFCDENWFRDLDDYMNRLEEQNKLLSEQMERKETIRKQEKLLNALYSFQEAQTPETVKQMEEALKEYREFYDMRCESGEKNDETK